MILNNIIDEPMNYVAVDNRIAAKEAVESLIRLGHINIATISGDTSTQAGLMRLEGYRDALSQADLKAPRSYTTFGDFLRTPARVAAKKLLKFMDLKAEDLLRILILKQALSLLDN